MSALELDSLKTELLDAIARRRRPRALEEVRIAALGRKGRVSELMQTLGSLPPEERKSLRPGGQQPERARRRGARGASARCWPRRATVDEARARARRRHAPGARRSARRGPHPSGQPGHRRDHRDLRRYGLLDRRGSGHRDRLQQFHRAQHPARASGAAGARHVLFRGSRRRHAAGAAHAHEPGADPDHAASRSRRSASSRRAASIAATATRRTRRCSIRSRAW